MGLQSSRSSGSTSFSPATTPSSLRSPAARLPPRQRIWGIILGAGAAVVCASSSPSSSQYVLELPWLRLVGGLLLLWIAIKLLVQEEADEDSVESSDNLWGAVKTVAIADIVMSLDNVLAIAAAAHGDTHAHRLRPGRSRFR